MKKESLTELKEQDLQVFVHQLHEHSKPGAWFFLEGDLGAGKTTLVQKWLQNQCDQDAVSPTFGIMNIYDMSPAKNHFMGIAKVIHVDLYRIKTANEFHFLGIDEIFDPTNTLCIFEWASLLTKEDWSNFFNVTNCRMPNSLYKITIRHATELSRLYSIENQTL